MRFGIRHPVIIAACLMLAAAIVTPARVMAPPETNRKMELTSTAFKDGQPIPRDYTCDGRNVSPPLAWKGAPANTAGFVLIVDDPDAPSGVWTHWVLFNLPRDTSNLDENATSLSNAVQGVNDFKKTGYGGPCPPSGKAHRYFFKLYALDTTLNLPAGAARKDVEAAMTKHILAQGQLMGTYQRK